MRSNLSIAATVAAFAVASLVAFPAGADDDDDDNGPRTRTVNCAAGRSIQTQLDRARPGDTVEVNGTCTENVVMRTSRVNLVAGADGGGITAADPNDNVVEVRALDVTITGLAITGGSTGITLLRGGSGAVTDTTVTGYSRSGLTATQNSYGRFEGNTVTGNNVGTGIVVVLSSSADILNNSLSNSATGIFMSRNGSADIVGNSVTDNIGTGVLVLRGSVAEFSGDVISGNAPNLIEGNGGNGIFCASNAAVRFGAAQDFGTGNTGPNFIALTPPNGTGCSVTGNPGV